MRATIAIVNQGLTPGKSRNVYSAFFVDYAEAVTALSQAYRLSVQDQINLYLDGYVQAPLKLPTRICLFQVNIDETIPVYAVLVEERMLEYSNS